jgi:hypothetical protein
MPFVPCNVALSELHFQSYYHQNYVDAGEKLRLFSYLVELMHLSYGLLESCKMGQVVVPKMKSKMQYDGCYFQEPTNNAKNGPEIITGQYTGRLGVRTHNQK